MVSSRPLPRVLLRALCSDWAGYLLAGWWAGTRALARCGRGAPELDQCSHRGPHTTHIVLKARFDSSVVIRSLVVNLKQRAGWLVLEKGIDRHRGTMDALDYWRLCDALSVVQAALLIVDGDPSEAQSYI
jgi:hypothetical protein